MARRLQPRLLGLSAPQSSKRSTMHSARGGAVKRCDPNKLRQWKMRSAQKQREKLYSNTSSAGNVSQTNIPTATERPATGSANVSAAKGLRRRRKRKIVPAKVERPVLDPIAYTNLRWEKYQAARGRCEKCGGPAPFYTGEIPSWAGQLHHVHGRTKGRRDDVNDTVWICGRCHNDIHCPKAVPPKVRN